MGISRISRQGGIRWISWLGGIRWISWPWNQADSTLPWNLADSQIWWISWQGLIYTANLACNRLILLVDHEGLHFYIPKWANNVYLYWFWWKIQHSVVDHEIRRISWQGLIHCRNLACNRLIMYICIGSDEKYSIQWYTMKSGGFHEIQRISWWNPADFIHEIRWISWLILKNANLKM